MNEVFDNYLFEAFANASDNIYVYVTDMKTDVTRWSKKAVDFFGLESEYLKDVKNIWRSYIHPKDLPIFQTDIDRVFSGESTQHNCQYRARSRYGEYVWVECRGSIVFDQGGQPAAFAGIMTRLDNQNKYDALTHQLSGYELFRQSIIDNGAILLVGIDKLRNINSQHGNLGGNEAINCLAKIISRCCPSSNTIYRYWGGDFVIYGKRASADDMVVLFEQISEICANMDRKAGVPQISISAGVVEFTKEDDISTLMKRAEMAMAYAKSDSSSKIAVYTQEIERRQKRKNLVSEALLESIRDNFRGFHLVYQPIMSHDGTKVVGCESLLRWDSKDEQIGSCYPDEFIPILEENGGIKEVGYFVMREAIGQLAEWHKKYEKIKISFNVSYLQLEDPTFIPSIISTVEEFKVDPKSIVMELTESVFASDTVMVKKSFEMLRRFGIKIALDDFGTGNTSFWTVHNIDVDIIKVDQSFIRGLNKSGEGIDYAIVESVVLMCKLIGCYIIAEGVENDVVWSLIDKFDFSALQGYLFSRPVDPEVFETKLVKLTQ